MSALVHVASAERPLGEASMGARRVGVGAGSMGDFRAGLTSRAERGGGGDAVGVTYNHGEKILKNPIGKTLRAPLGEGPEPHIDIPPLAHSPFMRPPSQRITVPSWVLIVPVTADTRFAPQSDLTLSTAMSSTPVIAQRCSQESGLVPRDLVLRCHPRPCSYFAGEVPEHPGLNSDTPHTPDPVPALMRRLGLTQISGG